MLESHGCVIRLTGLDCARQDLEAAGCKGLSSTTSQHWYEVQNTVQVDIREVDLG